MGRCRRSDARRVAFAARLLAGEVPPELEAVFDSAGVALLPRRWSNVRASCSCPDPESPCKHVAAVLYVFADRLDDDPWLLLSWRGRTREQLLGHLHLSDPDPSTPIAPWWPLLPATRLPEPSSDVDDVPAPPTTATAVLHRCDPLDVDVRGQAVIDLIAPAYDTLVHLPADPARDG